MSKAIDKIQREINDIIIKLKSREITIYKEILELKKITNNNLNDLETNSSKIKEESLRLDDYINKLNKLSYFFNVNPDEKIAYFSDFKVLDSLLKRPIFSIKDSLEIISCVINKNLSNDLINSGFFNGEITKEDFDRFKVNVEQRKRIYDIFGRQNPKTGEIDRDLLKEDEELLDRMIKYKNKHSNLLDPDKKTAMQVFKRHYIDKDYTKIDIKFIISSLTILEFDKELVFNIKGYLEEVLKKTKIKKETKEEKKVKGIEIKSRDYKEYNKIYNEIETMYDFDTKWFKKPIDLEELIYLISLMKKVDIDEKVMKQCILNFNKDKITNNNYKSSKSFEIYFNRLVFYSDKYPEIKESIEFIKSCLQEMMIANDEDYGLWKSMIIEEMNKYNDLLKQKYEYEMERGRSLN